MFHKSKPYVVSTHIINRHRDILAHITPEVYTTVVLDFKVSLLTCVSFKYIIIGNKISDLG